MASNKDTKREILQTEFDSAITEFAESTKINKLVFSQWIVAHTLYYTARSAGLSQQSIEKLGRILLSATVISNTTTSDSFYKEACQKIINDLTPQVENTR